MKRSVMYFLIFNMVFILYSEEYNDQLFSLKKYNLKWGMSRQEIMNIKDPNFHCTDLYCCISDFQLLGGKYLCSLYFEENKLTFISIMIKDNITKEKGMILLNKYTEKINKFYGKNKGYKRENKLPEKNKKGKNILYYDIVSYWTRPDGKVHLVLTGMDDSCYLDISYFSWMSFSNMNKEKTPKVEYEIHYYGVKRH